MKKKTFFESKYIQIGIIAFLVIVACITFFLIVTNLNTIFKWIGSLLSILMPLIIGLIMAYIMNPIVNFFEKRIFKNINSKHVKRNVSIFVTLIVILGFVSGLFYIIIPQLLESIQNLIGNAPRYLNRFEEYITEWIKTSPGEDTSVLATYEKLAEYITGGLNDSILPLVDSALTSLSSGIMGVFRAFFNFIIGLVFAVYILANTKNFSKGIRKTLYALFDVEKVNNFIYEVKHVNSVFSNFMVGKICDSFFFVAVMTFLFLVIFDFPYPLLIAVIIGLSDLIPYFGPYIGTVPSALLICLVSPIKAVIFVLFILCLQQIDGNLVTPRIQGKATGLPSFWVLFAITLFGGLFGLVGLLIGVPCFTIIYEIINNLIDKKLEKKKLSTSKDDYEKTMAIPVDKIKEKM